ncbi:MAG: hypothetical protein JWM50_344 [Microbacteriaceae bacterium]|jgi:hypothetical protein|nr:hypothetical protein [Microbacteriaceae bacterium]
MGQTSTAEYDAFGPWIDEVHSADELPRLYRDYPVDLDEALLVLKFPRDISRRDASPTMHLYDCVAIVAPDRLILLSRTGDTYTVLSVVHSDVAAIVDRVNLLDARLSLHTVAGDVVDLPYNGSSSDTVRALVDLLRELQPAGGRPDGLRDVASLPPLGLDDLGRNDAMFVTAYRELAAREPQLRLLAAHGRTRVGRRGGALSRLVDGVLPVTLHGAIVAAGVDDLQVLSRWDWLVRGGSPVLSRARTVVRLASVSSVTKAEHPRLVGVTVVSFGLGAGVVEIPVPTGSTAERALLAAGKR